MKECMHSKILILILPHSTILDNFFVSCYYRFYSHGRAIKSRSGEVYMKMKDKDREGGSLSEEDENKESAL